MSKNVKIFEVQNITKNFGGTQALKGVSFRLSKGEIVGLIGENGAGKSTLLKIIQGVQPQTSGEMFLHGKVFRPKNPLDANRSGVGMVFQEQNLVTTLSVGQNIFFGR
ncbi:MAG TPA: ATP-binding cassette domain-containing protein, partial [Candidatus Blautia gallistercoris]|nr:ATP-binding cassette domain-containing protein [Candidatus Blautia gallistercoris]